jgi:hypothetical protein
MPCMINVYNFYLPNKSRFKKLYGSKFLKFDPNKKINSLHTSISSINLRKNAMKDTDRQVTAKIGKQKVKKKISEGIREK